MGTRARLAAPAALLLAALASASCGKGEAVELRLRLEKGKTYAQDMEMEQAITQTLGGNESTMDQSIGMGIAYTVEDVDAAGDMKVSCTFDRVSLRQKGPMGEVAYDSRNPPPSVPPAAQGVAMLVGKGFRFTLGARGDAKEFQGMSAALEAMAEGLDVPEGPMRDSLMEGLKGQFGDEAMKDMMEKAMKVYPERPVAPGESWPVRLDLRKPMALSMDNTFRLVEVRGGAAVIDSESAITTPADAPPMVMGPVSVRYSLTGSQKGRMEMDVASGWVRSADLALELSGQLDIQGPGAQSVPMKIKGRVKLASRP
jgi:hypothetical protein